jgi:hypothetical protein
MIERWRGAGAISPLLVAIACSSEPGPSATGCSERPSIGTGTGLRGDYFQDRELLELVATHDREVADFSWRTPEMADPALTMPTYSVRWTGQVQAMLSGGMTFYTTSDDGVRLFIDDQLVIDDWRDHATTDDAAAVTLAAGRRYNVRLELKESGGGAEIDFGWGNPCLTRETIPAEQLYPSYTGLVCPPPATGSGTGLRGEYFGAEDFTDFRVTHDSESVDWDFIGGSSDHAVGPDHFSVRWTGELLARYTGPTTLHTISSGAVRVWLDGRLVIDDWTPHAEVDDSATMMLTAGRTYDLRIELVADTDQSAIHLLWSGPCQPLQPIPATQLSGPPIPIRTAADTIM